MGLGSAIMTPMAMAILPVLFAPAERARAISIMAAAMGLGRAARPDRGRLPARPLLVGLDLPGQRAGGGDRHGRRRAVHPGVARPPVAAGRLARRRCSPPPVWSRFVYGVIEAPRRGWSSGQVLVPLAVGLVLLVAFVIWERRCRVPHDRSWSVRPAPLPVGHRRRHRRHVRAVRAAVHAAAVLPGRAGRRTRSTPGCGCCR